MTYFSTSMMASTNFSVNIQWILVMSDFSELVKAVLNAKLKITR